MIRAMATDKLSATVDAGLLEEVRLRVGPRGLSSFVDQALRHELDRVVLRELLDELALELGPPDEAMVAEAEALLGARPTSAKSKARRARAG